MTLSGQVAPTIISAGIALQIPIVLLHLIGGLMGYAVSAAGWAYHGNDWNSTRIPPMKYLRRPLWVKMLTFVVQNDVTTTVRT